MPYIQLIKPLFPNAKIIFDRFHVVQRFHRILNNTRITIMKKNDQHYKKLKKHWKLLLKASAELDRTRLRYNQHFKKQMLQSDIVEFLINLDPMLKVSYDLYKGVCAAIKLNNSTLFRRLIDMKHDNLSDQMKKTVRTMKNTVLLLIMLLPIHLVMDSSKLLKELLLDIEVLCTLKIIS